MATEHYVVARVCDDNMPFTVSRPTAITVVSVAPCLGNPFASACLPYRCSNATDVLRERNVHEVKMAVIDEVD